MLRVFERTAAHRRLLQVKQAYKELSKQRHPDRVAPARRVAAEADFKALGQAYNAALRRACRLASLHEGPCALQ